MLPVSVSVIRISLRRPSSLGACPKTGPATITRHGDGAGSSGPRSGRVALRRQIATLPELCSLDALTDLVRARTGLFVRWSKGPDEDRGETSRDHASGLVVDIEPVARIASDVLHEATWRAPESARCEDDDTSWRS
jgi:hypothetical protein